MEKEPNKKDEFKALTPEEYYQNNANYVNRLVNERILWKGGGVEKKPDNLLLSEEILPKEERYNIEDLQKTEYKSDVRVQVLYQELLSYHKALEAAELQCRGFQEEKNTAFNNSKHWQKEVGILIEECKKKEEEIKYWFDKHQQDTKTLLAEIKQLKELVKEAWDMGEERMWHIENSYPNKLPTKEEFLKSKGIDI